MKQAKGNRFLNSLSNVDPNISYRMKLRFTLVGGSTLADVIITNGKVGDSILIATSATTGFQLADQFRIRRITIQQASVGLAEVAIDSTSTNPSLAAPGRRVVGDSLGGSGVAYASYTPRKGEIMYEWQHCNSATRLFSLYTNGNDSAIVELDIDFRSNVVLAPTAVANALTGAVVGTIYFRGLDGLPVASSQLRPLGVPLGLII
jgi:hypothetical protein